MLFREKELEEGFVLETACLRDTEQGEILVRHPFKEVA
jgi:hypothetical protein